MAVLAALGGADAFSPPALARASGLGLRRDGTCRLAGVGRHTLDRTSGRSDNRAERICPLRITHTSDGGTANDNKDCPAPPS